VRRNFASPQKEFVHACVWRGCSLSCPINSRSATYPLAIGTDAVAEGEKLCLEVAREFPQTTFFAGKILFQKERWYQNLLHNETAMAIQKRLQWAGKTVVVVPARVS
jgi:hypothetical protein